MQNRVVTAKHKITELQSALKDSWSQAEGTRQDTATEVTVMLKVPYLFGCTCI